MKLRPVLPPLVIVVAYACGRLAHLERGADALAGGASDPLLACAGIVHLLLHFMVAVVAPILLLGALFTSAIARFCRASASPPEGPRGES